MERIFISVGPLRSGPVLSSSYHYFRRRVGTLEGRRRRSCLGVHKSEPDFQHLLQSRKTTVWNDFDYVYRRSLCMPPLSLSRFVPPFRSLAPAQGAFSYSIESSESTGAYVFELFNGVGGRLNDRLTPLLARRRREEF